MAFQIQIRRDSAANWTAADPTLAAGEIGLDTTNNRYKVGDGVTAWTSLDYYNFSSDEIVAISDKLGSEESAWRAAVNSVETFLSDWIDSEEAAWRAGLNSDEVIHSDAILKLTSDLKLVSDSLLSDETVLSDRIFSVDTAWRTAVNSDEVVLSDSVVKANSDLKLVSDKLVSEEAAWRAAVNSVETFLSDTILNPTVVDLCVNEHAYFDAETNNGNSGAADTIDWTVGNKQRSTLTDNCTYTFTAPTGPCNLILKMVQDGTGSRNPVWPATVKWPAGTEPTWTTGANSSDIVAFYFDGTNYFGSAILNFS